MEKTGDAETKANLQPPFYVREIDSKCPKSYCPSVKKDKEDANQEHRNEASKDKDKAKSHTPVSKKRQGQQGGPPATGVNATEVAKKDKNKAKDLSHVKCYTCKQKGHYVSKYPKKSKNYWQSRQISHWWLRKKKRN